MSRLVERNKENRHEQQEGKKHPSERSEKMAVIREVASFMVLEGATATLIRTHTHVYTHTPTVYICIYMYIYIYIYSMN